MSCVDNKWFINKKKISVNDTPEAIIDNLNDNDKHVVIRRLKNFHEKSVHH